MAYLQEGKLNHNLHFVSEKLLSIIPGPETVEWAEDSQMLFDIAEYPLEEIRNLFNNLENTKLIKDGRGDWYNYLWEWQKGQSIIRFDFSTMFDIEGNETLWGGSSLYTDCLFSDLIDFWLNLRRFCPRIWLHDWQCNIYSPNAFIREYALPILEQSAVDGQHFRSLKLQEEMNVLKSLIL
ncbi:MAG TPA: hypothetical protein PLZ08_03295 [Bacillota bacterium]|nr:hypothetical protein [Bacillota bacterium]HOL08553.1 hypothetical protein [Bacillota bacterium]HPO96966.1 hypothetical protein [Bacillota bacterium]